MLSKTLDLMENLFTYVDAQRFFISNLAIVNSTINNEKSATTTFYCVKRPYSLVALWQLLAIK